MTIVPNRLADQASPYLLQHKDNPVHWQPWDEQARGEAAERDVPMVVSIGYSACHWCHVMEHESFEDPQTAAYMNEHFVCIKVDREERPDVDAIYMSAVQGMTGHGGWPLNVFCDPEGVPFYGGTYFPPEPRQGMPSFRMVLEGVSDAWTSRRTEIQSAATQTVERLAAGSRLQAADEALSPAALDEAERTLGTLFDAESGGFGGAPKFPPASALEFLMARMSEPDRDSARGERMVRTTLRQMAAGGIYDQVGGGFARYSVDARWLVPHFEKMLYDNALLARCYLHGWQLTGDELFRRVCSETLDWALREMRGPEGGFHSALDADSEGVEGAFYVWTESELRELLGSDAAQLLHHWGVDRGPNFEGRSILHVADEAIDPELLARARAILYEARSRRVRPGLDDKRLTSWNALMVTALADAGAVLERKDYVDAARACAQFLAGEMRDQRGRLLRTYKDGRGSLNAYLEDYAYCVEALLKLYEATFELRWFNLARELATTMIDAYADPGGGFFTTSDDHEQLVVRPKDIEDHPIPSGNSSAALGLLRLARFTADEDYERRAVELLQLLHVAAARHPQAFGHLLQAIWLHFAPRNELALVGEPLEPLACVARGSFRPELVVAAMSESDQAAARAIPLLRDRTPLDGRAAAYVCENFACRLPVNKPEELSHLLDQR
ncbi:MAG: thioredoxin domain-containing protein [Solirubrobacterales bacterium]